MQAFGMIFVHQKANRAAVHPINGLFCGHEAMQCLQHQSIAAQRHNNLGLFRHAIAIEAGQMGEGQISFGGAGAEKGDFVIFDP